MTEHVDVVIVGAGLSGVGQAYHLQRRCPDRRYVILEGRGAMGGTWDLFRYPGVRSDSDMHTLGFAFQPWTEAKAIADGASIRDYIEATAREHGIDRHIRYRHHVRAASWSTPDARWTVEATGPDGEAVTITCDFLCMCSGYYDYAQGHTPDFPDSTRFAGRIVHPQFWPDDLDYAGRRVVVIGSGATAVTLVPEMAKTAAHVTMLQRSPTYVVSRPAEDGIANWLRARLPHNLAYGITRWKNVLLGMVFYRIARKRPEKFKQRLIGMVRDHLGPDYDVDTHFTPRYNPWDQRLCLVPDADLFAAIRDGRASVVTGTIDRFTETGIRLSSGEALAADIIVTATGLQLQLLSDIVFSRDGQRIDLSQAVQYKGMMFSDVPNLAYTFGYTNASWTLKADLVATYVCRLLNTMRRRGLRQATPRIADPAMGRAPFVDFTSGYVARAAHFLPSQGTRKPWRLNQNYALDVLALRFGSLDDEMEFSNPEPVADTRAA
ncbi:MULTISPECIES: NAD(P)/FAD-dependent oxidoreductase [unclassified Sphingomonas]|jgi:monooxygenase|uniref:flavin-containing monooxygenase n=1 Tax=unclassified Sphingomonas TaxID=196159 RepID=UPI000E10960E|nr:MULTISPECIES: NAD(P)/FAD-dependent oxidoreductase [unclassified Sphingomonas]AXJ96323.1 FAD-containing monooxygenase EthA [Sphingomonas sp. FARSPH]